MVGSLLSLLLVVIVLAIIWWVVTQLPLPPIVRVVVIGVFAIIFVIILFRFVGVAL